MKTVMTAVLLVIAGCSPTGQSPRETEPILLSEREVTFSTAASKDLFRLVGLGSDTLDAEMTFMILNQGGDTLFAESFPSRYLLDYGFVGEDTSSANVRSYIARRVNRFFDQDEFSSPAVPLSAEPDAGFSYTNLTLWEELRGDTSAVLFHFLTGEEYLREIAYSRKRGRVEVLRSFD